MDQRMSHFEADVTQIRTLLEVLVEETRDMKSKVDGIAALDKELALLREHHESHIADAKHMRSDVNDLQSTSEETESFINKVKGALILIGFLQAALIGGATWIVTQVVDSRQDIAVLQYMVNKSERDQANRVGPLMVPNISNK